MKPGSTATSKPGVVRYMAPELLNPSQFGLKNGNPSKESDVYSLAMTALEVLFSSFLVGVTHEHPIPITRYSRGSCRMVQGGRRA